MLLNKEVDRTFLHSPPQDMTYNLPQPEKFWQYSSYKTVDQYKQALPQVGPLECLKVHIMEDKETWPQQ